MKRSELKRKTRMKPGKGLRSGSTLKSGGPLKSKVRLKPGKPLKAKARMKPGRKERATADEARRMSRIADAGCICCWLNCMTGRGWFRNDDGRMAARPTMVTTSLAAVIAVYEAIPAEVHHLLDGARRRGHRFTIGLCCWHHRGDVPAIISKTRMAELAGPALSEGTQPFKERFGTDDVLLALQDELLKLIYGGPAA